jgi:GT2 family glycosyltransferase
VTTPPARPFVSVIIPTLDNVAGLARCLAPLEAQTYAANRYEILVVDNGSREDVQSAVAAFPHVRFFREEKPGSYAARNLGLAVANGTVIAFTDSDCIPDRAWIENGVAGLLASPKCGLVAGRIELFFRDRAHPTPSELYDSIVMNFHQDRNVAERRFGATANLFAFKQVFEAVGVFNSQLMSGGDLEWGRRVSERGYPLAYAPNARVSHPARHTLRETYEREVRLVGGRYRMKAEKRAPAVSFAMDLVRAITPAIGFYVRLYRDPRLTTARDRASVIRVALGVKYVGAWELIRLMMGGKPRRGSAVS